MNTRRLLPLLFVAVMAAGTSAQIIGTAGGSRGPVPGSLPRIVPVGGASLLTVMAPTAVVVGAGQVTMLQVSRAEPGGRVILVVSPERSDRTFAGGVLRPDLFAPGAFALMLRADELGRLELPIGKIPPDVRLYVQAFADPRFVGPLQATQAFLVERD
jgi:hypothetical protein